MSQAFRTRLPSAIQPEATEHGSRATFSSGPVPV